MCDMYMNKKTKHRRTITETEMQVPEGLPKELRTYPEAFPMHLLNGENQN